MSKIEAKNVDFYYGSFHALKNINMNIEENEVVAFIGPSGCGKSTFLRLFNRMNDLIPGSRLEGVPAPQPVPEEHIRERGLRTARERREGRDVHSRARREITQGRGSLGRGERQTQEVGLRPLRRPAAASVHSARHGRGTVGTAHGRACVGS